LDWPVGVSPNFVEVDVPWIGLGSRLKLLEVFIWRSRFIWRSGFICGGRDKIVFYKKPILWNVESGDNSVYKISKPCRLTRCNVEAYERTKANTCHLLYPVINQW